MLIATINKDYAALQTHKAVDTLIGLAGEGGRLSVGAVVKLSAGDAVGG